MSGGKIHGRGGRKGKMTFQRQEKFEREQIAKRLKILRQLNREEITKKRILMIKEQYEKTLGTQLLELENQLFEKAMKGKIPVTGALVRILGIERFAVEQVRLMLKEKGLPIEIAEELAGNKTPEFIDAINSAYERVLGPNPSKIYLEKVEQEIRTWSKRTPKMLKGEY